METKQKLLRINRCNSIDELLLKEKMDKQKLINKSLEILLKDAKDKILDVKEAIKQLGYTIKDYQEEEYIIPKNYLDEYEKLQNEKIGEKS